MQFTENDILKFNDFEMILLGRIKNSIKNFLIVPRTT